MSEAKKGELAIRDKAILHQQRRLKQATQFMHKDSADLLPLDGLKRLGTSKDLVSADTVLNDGRGSAVVKGCEHVRRHVETKSGFKFRLLDNPSLVKSISSNTHNASWLLTVSNIDYCSLGSESSSSHRFYLSKVSIQFQSNDE